MPAEPSGTDFEGFVMEAEPRLHRALVSAWGVDLGREATSSALVYAWEHWDRVKALENPVGFLYRVGYRSVRRPKEVPMADTSVAASDHEVWVEPELESALGSLPQRQRTYVVLHHCFGWTHAEIAAVLELSRSTVQIERGMRRLRLALEVEIDA